MKNKLPGVGLRPTHYQDLLSEKKSELPIGWLEVISENFINNFGRGRATLEKIAQDYPLSFHGVSLNIASPNELNRDYLQKLKKLVQDFNPIRISDHLCWTGINEKNYHDLLPFPYCKESLSFIAEKIQRVQDVLGRPLILENLSTYLSFNQSEMTEMEFLTELCRKSGSLILLDINNLYVNYKNHGIDPYKVIASIDIKLISEVHLAGFTNRGEFLFDTHSNPVADDVWELFQQFYSRQDIIPYCIEWDEDIPGWNRLMEEVNKGELLRHGLAANTSSIY